MKCSKCNVEMEIFEMDVFDYRTNSQMRDVPHFRCPECGRIIPYVEEVEE